MSVPGGTPFDLGIVKLCLYRRWLEREGSGETTRQSQRPVPEDLISNNGFGGDELRTLYVTAGKTLFKFRTDIPGLPR